MNMQFFHQVFFITLITSDRKVFEKNIYLDIKSVIIVCFQIKKKKKKKKTEKISEAVIKSKTIRITNSNEHNTNSVKSITYEIMIIDSNLMHD